MPKSGFKSHSGKGSHASQHSAKKPVTGSDALAISSVISEMSGDKLQTAMELLTTVSAPDDQKSEIKVSIDENVAEPPSVSEELEYGVEEAESEIGMILTALEEMRAEMGALGRTMLSRGTVEKIVTAAISKHLEVLINNSNDQMRTFNSSVAALSARITKAEETMEQLSAKIVSIGRIRGKGDTAVDDKLYASTSEPMMEELSAILPGSDIKGKQKEIVEESHPSYTITSSAADMASIGRKQQSTKERLAAIRQSRTGVKLELSQ